VQNKTLHIPNIGAIVLVRSHRAKRLNITMKPFREVRVAVPRGISYAHAEKFVYKRLDWIKRHRLRVQEVENKLTIFDEHTQFATRDHQLQIEKSDSDKLIIRVGNGRIHINCPRSMEITAQEVQAAIREGIERAWRKEAKAYLPGRVKALAAQHGFVYKQVFIKNTKTRWGSCSSKNNINLSLHLMRLPDHLVDYVILHELVHTAVKNHGRQFWRLLDEATGNARELEMEMKNHGLRIY
jgi:predicted metal-dependent hydrolase